MEKEIKINYIYGTYNTLIITNKEDQYWYSTITN